MSLELSVKPSLEEDLVIVCSLDVAWRSWCLY